MPAHTPNPRGAEFWNSTMGHAWVSQQAVISDVFTSVTSVSLEAAAAKLGEHVIDIGCGTGDTLLAFAKAVGPSGAVLGVDVSAPMLDFAKHRAAEATLSNAAFALADATSYAFEPSWADLVYSRFGVMFFDDPIRAFTNIRSGMKAGGRLVFVCFRTMPVSPWFRVPIEAAWPHACAPRKCLGRATDTGHRSGSQRARRKYWSRRARPACGAVACVGVSLAKPVRLTSSLPSRLVTLFGPDAPDRRCPLIGEEWKFAARCQSDAIDPL